MTPVLPINSGTGGGGLPIAFLLSGQGSHYRGMGRPLFEADPVFRQWMFWADHLGQREFGFSLVDELYGPPVPEPFDRLRVTHPAIYAVELAMCRMLESWGLRPDCLVGASLGEYATMAVAGAVAPEAMFRLLVAQATGFEDHAPRGGMTAVLGPADLPSREPGLFVGLEVAAMNFQEHFVVSGPSERLTALETSLQARAILYQRLEVAFPFHARFIDPAEPMFQALAADITILEAALPLVSCADTASRRIIPRGHLWQIVRQPIRFAETIHALERRGPHLYIDVGPSGTLSTFVKYLLGPTANGRTLSLMTPALANIKTLRGQLEVAGLA